MNLWEILWGLDTLVRKTTVFYPKRKEFAIEEHLKILPMAFRNLTLLYGVLVAHEPTYTCLPHIEQLMD